MTTMDRLLEVAGQQRGFVTAADAAGVDVDPVELRKLAARGRLERISHGVYRFPTFPRRPNDELMAAVLWTGKRGVIGGQSALAFLDLCDVNPHRIELVVPPDYRPRRAGGEQYRIRRTVLGSRDIDIVDDIPVVTPAIAIGMAVAARMDPRLIEQAIRTARRRDDGFPVTDLDDAVDRVRRLITRIDGAVEDFR